METNLVHINLNLQEGMIWTGSNSSNSICAIYSKHKKVIVVRPEYRELKDAIIQKIVLDAFAIEDRDLNGWTVKEGDSFRIDTWDHKIYGPPAEREKLELISKIINSETGV